MPTTPPMDVISLPSGIAPVTGAASTQVVSLVMLRKALDAMSHVSGELLNGLPPLEPNKGTTVDLRA